MAFNAEVKRYQAISPQRLTGECEAVLFCWCQDDFLLLSSCHEWLYPKGVIDLDFLSRLRRQTENLACTLSFVIGCTGITQSTCHSVTPAVGKYHNYLPYATDKAPVWLSRVY